jgi:hypothetical protein
MSKDVVADGLGNCQTDIGHWVLGQMLQQWQEACSKDFRADCRVRLPDEVAAQQREALPPHPPLSGHVQFVVPGKQSVEQLVLFSQLGRHFSYLQSKKSHDKLKVQTESLPNQECTNN